MTFLQAEVNIHISSLMDTLFFSLLKVFRIGGAEEAWLHRDGGSDVAGAVGGWLTETLKVGHGALIEYLIKKLVMMLYGAQILMGYRCVRSRYRLPRLVFLEGATEPERIKFYNFLSEAFSLPLRAKELREGGSCFLYTLTVAAVYLMWLPMNRSDYRHDMSARSFVETANRFGYDHAQLESLSKAIREDWDEGKRKAEPQDDSVAILNRTASLADEVTSLRRDNARLQEQVTIVSEQLKSMEDMMKTVVKAVATGSETSGADATGMKADDSARAYTRVMARRTAGAFWQAGQKAMTCSQVVAYI